MYNKAKGSEEKQVTVKGVVFEKKKQGLMFKNLPQKELGKVSASGTDKGEVTMDVYRKAEKKYGKKISVKFT